MRKGAAGRSEPLVMESLKASSKIPKPTKAAKPVSSPCILETGIGMLICSESAQGGQSGVAGTGEAGTGLAPGGD